MKILEYLSWKLDVATQVFTAFSACLSALSVLTSVCGKDICSFLFLLCDNSFLPQCYKYKCTIILFSDKWNRIAVYLVKFFYYSIILFSILKLLGGVVYFKISEECFYMILNHYSDTEYQREPKLILQLQNLLRQAMKKWPQTSHFPVFCQHLD